MTDTKFTDWVRDELGLQLTAGQRVLACIAFDGDEPRDLPDDERAICAQLFGEIDEVPPLARRVLCLRLGRNSGKTLLSAAYALFVLATDDLSACGPGDVPVALTVAPTKRLGALAVRAGLDLARRSPRLRARIERETSDGFQLRRRDGRTVAFEAVAASRGGATGRGQTILVALLDEAEFFLSDEGGAFAINDRDIYSAIAPRARRTIFISTPWFVGTLMSELHAANWANPTTALAATASTLVMRDGDAAIAEVIEAERARDPANARREFDAIDDGSSGARVFFDPAALAAAVDPVRTAAIAAPRGATVAAGGDLALSRDASTLAIVGSVNGHMHLLETAELRPEPGAPLKLSAVIAEFAATAKRHGCRAVALDGWNREAAREHAEPLGLGLTALPEGRAGKQEQYLAARAAFAEGRITLPANARLMSQLRSLTVRQAPGGTLQISAPRRAGSHGDLASALVAAIWATTRALDTTGLIDRQDEADAWVYARGAHAVVLAETPDGTAAALAVGWVTIRSREDADVYINGRLTRNPRWFEERIVLNVVGGVDLPANVNEAGEILEAFARHCGVASVWARVGPLGVWRTATRGISLRDAANIETDDASGVARLKQLVRAEQIRCGDPALAAQLSTADATTSARARAACEAARLDVAGCIQGSPMSRRIRVDW